MNYLKKLSEVPHLQMPTSSYRNKLDEPDLNQRYLLSRTDTKYPIFLRL